MAIRFDLVAGLSIAGLLPPEAIAHASPPPDCRQHALFAAIAGLIVYAAIGRSPAIVALDLHRPRPSSARLSPASRLDIEPALREPAISWSV